ncbi:hypothetical protein TNCV_3471241 [Trichonephila clavipes]|nr:hypothetical protein TNCV_3471241 [Trichonephila clavipes]
MPLDNKCRIGPLAGAPQTRVRWSSALRLNRDSSLKMTRLQSVTLQVARGRQNPVDTAYDVGSVVSVLADVGSSSQLRSVVSLWFLLMALDVWKGAATTISLRPRGRPIRLFDQPASLRPIIRPIKVRSAARTAAGYVLVNPKSQYRLSKSSDSFG